MNASGKALAVLLVLSTGCATIFRGMKESVTVTCSTPGATLDLDGTAKADPGTIKLTRGDVHLVYVRAPGYESRTVQFFNSTCWPMFLIDLVLFPSLLVDSWTGAIDDLDPETVDVKLEAKPWPAGPERWPQIDAGMEGKAKVYCPYCGARLVDGARFCPHCGKEQ